MTECGNTPQSKCRMWEKQRRSRLSAAFSALAEVLPSMPPTATKILILQRSVKYIKELQEKNAALLDAENKNPKNISVLLDKLSILEERCSQLIQHMQQSGVSVSSSLLLNADPMSKSTAIIDSPRKNIQEKTQKDLPSPSHNVEKDVSNSDDVCITKNVPELVEDINSDVLSSKESVVSIKKKVTLKKIIKKKNKKKCITKQLYSLTDGINITSPQKSDPLNNVWVTNNTQNGSVLVGNMILPLMPKTPQILMPPNPQPIFLLQRPLVQNHHNIMRDNLLDGSFPVVKHLMDLNPSDRQFSQVYSFDVTRTTMVNKMPIPAVSSAVPIFKLKTSNQTESSCVKVSYKNRSRLLKSLKAAKKTDVSKPEVDKENITKSKTDIVSKCVESKEVAISTTKSASDDSNQSKDCSGEKSETGVPLLSDIPMSDGVSNAMNQSTDVESNQQKPTDNGTEISVSLDKEKTTKDNPVISSLNNYNDKENTSLSCNHDQTSEQKSNSFNGSENHSKCQGVHEISLNNSQENMDIKKVDSVMISEKIVDKNENLKNKPIEMEVDKMDDVQETIRPPQNPECRLQINKSAQGSNILNTNELTEDLLASFVAPTEQTASSSLLNSSPLATSPTAAFLLTFPLVSSGPRPDTPNDNLQASNICSLDNFSNFFIAKDLPGANHLSLANNHIAYSDCQSKQLSQINNEKIKSIWPLPHNGEQNYLKPSDINNGSKNDGCPRVADKNPVEKSSVVSSSNCVYTNNQENYMTTKLSSINNQYSLNDNLFNYEETTVSNQKVQNGEKNQVSVEPKNSFAYDSLQENVAKSKPTHITVTSNSSVYPNNVTASVSCNFKSYNYGLTTLNSSGNANAKRDHLSENSMKPNFSATAPHSHPVSKHLEVPFSFQSQGKSIFTNSSNIYTSCNTYNPYSAEFSSNSMNLGLSCGNGINNAKAKPATAYFPEYNSSNVCSQNVWNEENQIDYDHNKNDQNKKLNISSPSNQNSGSANFQNASLPPTSKCSEKQILTDNKNAKSGKYNGKDSKFISTDKNKIDYANQKGPVNWMTSDVIAQHGNDSYYSNYKEIKSEQNLMLTNPAQTCLDPVPNITSISSLGCKKTDLFEQPFFHLPASGYTSQVTNEDNQFTWSPSKLTTFSESTLVPCSLPTLVGDLALGIIAEPKLTYPIISEHDSTVKDRKTLHKNKDVYEKINNVQTNDINSSQQAVNYFSVSQLMERGKMSENSESNKVCVQENLKRNTVHHNDHRNFNPQPNTVKPFESVNCGVGNFSMNGYSVQNHTENAQVPSKNFNKIDNVTKSVNKNNYSAEALLQNDNSHYQMNRKQKQNINVQKIYGDNGGYSIHGNQFMPSNHPIPFDNFPQSQQYAGNTFPYPSSTATVNSTFYSSSNFISSTNMTAPNYINGGFTADLNEYQNSGDTLFFAPKLDGCKSKSQNENYEFIKYPNNAKQLPGTKESGNKNKSEGCIKKDTTPPNKRQKKVKNSYPNNYGVPERCFGQLPNQGSSPMGIDESYFGYASTGQMHQFSQSSLLPTIQSSGQHMPKGNFPPKLAINSNMSASPNPPGTSLTNFNLSTIFPEINKRTSMAVFNDPQHLIGQPTKPPPITAMFHNM